jgi:hypothetical protein
VSLLAIGLNRDGRPEVEQTERWISLLKHNARCRHRGY